MQEVRREPHGAPDRPEKAPDTAFSFRSSAAAAGTHHTASPYELPVLNSNTVALTLYVLDSSQIGAAS